MKLKIRFIATNVAVNAVYDKVTGKIEFFKKGLPSKIAYIKEYINDPDPTDGINNSPENVFLILFANTNIPVKAEIYGYTPYDVDATITNGTIEGPSAIFKGGNFTIVPNENYGLPTSVTVTGATSMYSASTGHLELYDVTGDITITATCPAEEVESEDENTAE